MIDVVWLAAWVAVTVAGAAIVRSWWSRVWVAAGIAFMLAGIGCSTYIAVDLTGALDHPAQSSADDVAVWFVRVGSLAVLAAAVLTLIAMGRRSRHRFLIVLAMTTFAVATLQFWTTNWVARYGDTSTRCSDTGHQHAPGRIQRIPPGMYCEDAGREVFLPADAISWLALAGWSTFCGFFASFPVMGLAWAGRRRPALAPAQPPGTTR